MLERLINTYSWINPGGVENLRFIVVQIGKIIQIIDTSVEPYSAGIIYQETVASTEDNPRFSFTTVNSELVVATNQADIFIYTYENGSVSKRVGRLKIRDMFGVEDIWDGKDLTEGLGLVIRPRTITDNHVYNLRNQTYATPKTNVSDMIVSYYNESNHVGNNNTKEYPSNSDNANYALAPNPANEYEPHVDRFWVKAIRNNPPGTYRSPMGYFIIDALARGTSRLEEYGKLVEMFPSLSFKTISLPADVTRGGARFVAEFAGRVFYAGFSNIVDDGDSKSPKLGSYVLYSQLVRSEEDAFKCYQDGDPTSKDNPDLLDTDGGMIRISGISNICYLTNVGRALMVFAENGVWMISGNGDDGFTANNQMTTKITERGTKYPNTITVVDGTVMYWSEDGIYHLRQNEYGDWGSHSMTEDTIQKFYEDISSEERLYAKGLYDSYDKKVRWVYNNFIGALGPSKELVFDTQLGAFYPNEIEPVVDDKFPRVCSLAIIPPYRVGKVQEDITYMGETIEYNGNSVTYPSLIPVSGTKEIIYLSAYSFDFGFVDYGFTTYQNNDFRDWPEIDGGVDAEAVLITGYLSGGDASRNKQVPYINFHLERTERGFEEDEDGNLVPEGESSCLVQAQWSWNNSPKNGKWGEPFQAYRYRRLYSPYGPTDNFDNGEAIISTRNKLRGIGKALSLKISSEPYKDLRLVGWSISMDMNSNV